MEDSSNIIVPYTKIIEMGEHVIGINCPPESIKRWSISGQASPNIIVIGDTSVFDSMPLCSPEFLVLNHVFCLGGYNEVTKKIDKPIYIIGFKRRLASHFEAMRMAFEGQTREELEVIGIEESVIEALIKDREYFIKRGPNSEPHGLQDFLIPVPFGEDRKAKVDDITIQHKGRDQYQIVNGVESVDVELSKEGVIRPTWQLPVINSIECRHRFGLYVLGSDNGFGKGATTTFLIEIDGRFILWDCSPYVSHTLRENGIEMGQIDLVFISHLHDDHAGELVALASNAIKRIELVGTKEVLAGIRIKTAALMNLNFEAIESLFIWREISVNTPEVIMGHTFEFIQGFHPISSIGAKITKNGKDIVTISGDTGFNSILDEAYDDGIVTEERRGKILASLNSTAPVLADVGDAGIHGKVKDFVGKSRAFIFFYHFGGDAPEIKGKANHIKPGTVYALTEPLTDIFNIPIIGRALQNIGVERWDRWATQFCFDSTVTRVENGHIISQGEFEDRHNVYIMLHGIASVEITNPKTGVTRQIDTISHGDIFGEKAIMANKESKATVVARSVCMVLLISTSKFMIMIEEEEKYLNGTRSVKKALEKIWDYRVALARSPMFKVLASQHKNALARSVIREMTFMQGVMILSKGDSGDEVYYITHGKVKVDTGRGNVAPTFRGRGEMIGEALALGWVNSRTADVIAETDVKVLVLGSSLIEELYTEVPHFRIKMIEMQEDRGIARR